MEEFFFRFRGDVCATSAAEGIREVCTAENEKTMRSIIYHRPRRPNLGSTEPMRRLLSKSALRDLYLVGG